MENKVLASQEVGGDFSRKKYLLLLSMLSIFHLFLLLMNFEGTDWRIIWVSSRLVVDGTPMYLQDDGVYYGIFVWEPPFHFPLYIYWQALLIKLFGPNPYIPRLFLWVFTNLTFLSLVDILEINNDRHLFILAFLFYLSPFLLIINYLAVFDQMAMMFAIIGFSMAKRGYPTVAGFLMALGLLTKFYPVMAMGSLGVMYLKRGEYLPLIKSSFGFLGSVVPIFYYLVDKYGFNFTRIILYQIIRDTPNFSFWYYILPSSLPRFGFLWVQAVLLLSIVVISFYLSSDRPIIDAISVFALYCTGFLLLTKQIYVYYPYWSTLPLIPLLYLSVCENNKQNIIMFLTGPSLFIVGILSCSLACLAPPDVITTKIYLSSFLVTSSFLISIISLILWYLRPGLK